MYSRLKACIGNECRCACMSCATASLADTCCMPAALALECTHIMSTTRPHLSADGQ